MAFSGVAPGTGQPMFGLDRSRDRAEDWGVAGPSVPVSGLGAASTMACGMRLASGSG